MDFVLLVVSTTHEAQLYDHCGNTLSIIFDLKFANDNAYIEPLLNISAIGNQCPPLRALKSSVTKGFTCSVGEVLNTDNANATRCCKYRVVNSRSICVAVLVGSVAIVRRFWF